MDKRYRYPGVQPFTEEDNLTFNGRESEIEILRRKLYVQNLVVLQSKSGYGKSSLINAGIKPLFAKDIDEFEYNFINFQFNELDKTPLQLFYNYLEIIISEKKLTLIEECRNINIISENKLSFKKKLEINKRLEYEEQLSKIYSVSLWYYFKRLQILEGYELNEYSYSTNHIDEDFNLDSKVNKPVKFFLILDQFEKLLFYPNEQKTSVEDFGKELADLYYQKIPKNFLEALSFEKFRKDDLYINQGLCDFLNKNPEWEDFLRKPTPLCILIGIRTDKLILIDRLSKFLPDLSIHKYELLPLSITGAQKAIAIPAQINSSVSFKSEAFIYDSDALDKILNFLAHPAFQDSKPGLKYVEAYQLQMICQHIEEKIIDGKIINRNKDGQIIVKAEDIDDLESIVRNYYRNELNKFSDIEKQIVQLFIEENLVLEQEKRRVFIDEGIARRELVNTYGIESTQLDSFINKLTDVRIIRREQSNHNNIYQYELSHDTLILPVLELKNERLVIEEENKKKEEENKKKREFELAQIKAKKARNKVINWLVLSIIFLLFILVIVFYYSNKAEREHELALFYLQKITTSETIAKSQEDSLTNSLDLSNENISKIRLITDSLRNIKNQHKKEIDQYKSEIDKMSKNIFNLSKKIKNNTDTITALKKNVAILSNDNTRLKKEIYVANSNITSPLYNTISQRDSTLRKLNRKYHESQIELMKLRMDYNQLKTKNNELLEKINKK